MITTCLLSNERCSLSPQYILAARETPRANSSTEKAVLYVLEATQHTGILTNLISGPLLQLPLYRPVNPERGEGRFLVAELAFADGIY
jgi:FMN reductase